MDCAQESLASPFVHKKHVSVERGSGQGEPNPLKLGEIGGVESPVSGQEDVRSVQRMGADQEIVNIRVLGPPARRYVFQRSPAS